jgi:hypothetical protein
VDLHEMRAPRAVIFYDAPTSRMAGHIRTRVQRRSVPAFRRAARATDAPHAIGSCAAHPTSDGARLQRVSDKRNRFADFFASDARARCVPSDNFPPSMAGRFAPQQQHW